MNKTITVETTVNRDIAVVWEYWTQPKHIQQWMHASSDWECRAAENDVRVGGHFSSTLAAKDGSTSFDIGGTYTSVAAREYLAYTMEDGRAVQVSFTVAQESVHIAETFEMELQNTEKKQREGWQAILNNFKMYCESM